MGEILVTVVLATLVYTPLLWLSSKITGGGVSFLGCLIVGAISAVIIALVPAIVGVFVAGLVMLILLVVVTKVDFFPDAFLMVVVANVIGNIIVVYTAAVLLKAAAGA